MITITHPGKAWDKFAGKCDHCECAVECEAPDLEFVFSGGVSAHAAVRCPRCNTHIQVKRKIQISNPNTGQPLVEGKAFITTI